MRTTNGRGHIVFGADPVGTISHEPMADFNQISMDITLGHVEELIMFWCPLPNFQGHCRT